MQWIRPIFVLFPVLSVSIVMLTVFLIEPPYPDEILGIWLPWSIIMVLASAILFGTFYFSMVCKNFRWRTPIAYGYSCLIGYFGHGIFTVGFENLQGTFPILMNTFFVVIYWVLLWRSIHLQEEEVKHKEIEAGSK